MPKKKPADQHKSGFLVRLPEAYRAKLQELKQKTDRPMAASVRRALDAYLKANGIEPPAASI
jgi:predicted DNA-binding protein